MGYVRPVFLLLSESKIRIRKYNTLLVYSVHCMFIGVLLSIFLLFVSLTYYYLYRFLITRGETADIEG